MRIVKAVVLWLLCAFFGLLTLATRFAPPPGEIPQQYQGNTPFDQGYARGAALAEKYGFRMALILFLVFLVWALLASRRLRKPRTA